MSDALASLAAKNADARRLATLASLAVQVEPELLRRLRLRLLPTADASAEADLWFSDLVDSKSPNAMVLRPDLRAQLQQELALSAADLDAAARIIAEMHAGVSEVVRIQEQVDALAMRGDPSALIQIEKVLQPIVRTLYDTDHAGLARWAARAFAQFQPSAQTTQTAWTMMRAAAGRLVGAGRAQPKVYVSGTFFDLWEYRAAVIETLRRLGITPLAVETQAVGAVSQVESFKQIDAADAFVGIVGFRHGKIPDDPEGNPEEKSFAEVEYERAMAHGKPVFMYLTGDEQSVTLDYADFGVARSQMFRARIASDSTSGASPSFFSSVAELKDLVARDLGRLFTKPSSGWQAVESSIRALPRTPLYVTVARHSLAVGTEAVEGAARIDVPATEPLLLDLSWEDGSQRVALAPGQSIELPADPRGLTATTILGEAHDIRVAQEIDDWAVVMGGGDDGAGDAELFRKWLLAPEGGAIPPEQCAFFTETPGWKNTVLAKDLMAQWEIDLQEKPRRRFYLYACGALTTGDRSFLSYAYMRNTLNTALQIFQEVVAFIDVPNGGAFKADEFKAVWILGVGTQLVDQPSFTSRLVEGLSGGIADDAGVVSDAGLINAFPDADWSGSLPLDLLRSDAFITCIEIRNRGPSDPLGFRILDEHFKEVARLPHEAPVRRRLLRGRYILDVPALSLVQRFETGDDAPLVHVAIEAPRENAPYIIVAGSAGPSLRSEEAWLAEAMGHRLAGSGFHLVTRAWQGVDEACLKAFTDTLSALHIPPFNRVFEIIQGEYPRGEWEGARANRIPGTADYDQSLRKAAAFVAIGGKGGTQQYAWRARELGVPVIPVASTWGDATLLYRQYSGPEWLTNPIENGADADAMAVRIVAWLLERLTRQDPHTLHEP